MHRVLIVAMIVAPPCAWAIGPQNSGQPVPQQVQQAAQPQASTMTPNTLAAARAAQLQQQARDRDAAQRGLPK